MNNSSKISNLLIVVFCALLCLVIFFYACLVHYPSSSDLSLTVNKVTSLKLFESKYLYALLHVFVFVPVFIMSFDKKVAFYKKWPFLFPAILISGFFFISWDIYFTELSVWGFNESYITGLSLFGLPIEELLFFFTVPYACVFIYECLDAYFPRAHRLINGKGISLVLGLLVLILGLLNISSIYFGVTMTMLGIGLLLTSRFDLEMMSKFYLMFVVALIPFVLVNGLLTGSFTEQPVVIYNPSEIIGFRFITIPMEDFFYNMLYLLAVIVLLECFRSKKLRKH